MPGAYWRASLNPIRRYLPVGLCALCLLPPAICAQDEPVDGDADSTDRVEIVFGDGQLQADSSHFFTDDQGQPVIRLANALYRSGLWQFSVDELLAWPDEQRLTANAVRFRYGDNATGSAETLRAHVEDSDGEDSDEQVQKLDLEQFTIAFCDTTEGGPGWSLAGRNLQMNTDEQLARIHGLSMRVLGVKLPGPPIARLPLDGRSVSGLLAPEIRLNIDDELDIVMPFLLTLGKAADLTLSPRQLGSLGPGLESELRYLTGHQSGNLVTVNLDTGDGRWRANAWSHRARWGNWKLDLKYADIDDESFLSRYGLASVSIPEVSGLYPQMLGLSWSSSLLDFQILSQRLYGPTGGRLGDHSRELDLRLHLADNTGPWAWQVHLEGGRYGWTGDELFSVETDRPLGAAESISRFYATGEINWRQRKSWGSFELGAQLARSDQEGNYQQSGTLQLDSSLDFRSGQLQLKPRLQLRATTFEAGGGPLQNIDSSLLSATAVSLWDEPVTGGDLVPSRNRATLGADLIGFGEVWQFRLGGAIARYSQTPDQALLNRLTPSPPAGPYRTEVLEWELQGGAGALKHRWLARLGNSDGGVNDRNDMHTLSWQMDGPFGQVSLRWSERQRGAGRNGRLRFIGSSLSARMTDHWKLSLTRSQDLQSDRAIFSSLAVHYENCCLAVGLSFSEGLYTRYSLATERQWLNWHDLPIAEWSNTVFSFRLKTGTH